jgi:uncharacterized membrane protein YqhA
MMKSNQRQRWLLATVYIYLHVCVYTYIYASFVRFDNEKTVVSDHKSHYTLLSNLGFATFVYLCGFILLVATSIYVSPTLCGSMNEKKIIQTPQEIDQGTQV